MNKSRILIIFAIVLFEGCLIGCTKEVKALPPFNKKIAAKECAVLVIPSRAKVNRIDGARRGLFSSWKGGSKAATLLVPAGEHTVIFEYSQPQEGWSAKKLECTVTMSAGKMYILSVKLNEKKKRSTFSTAINLGTSFIRDQVVDFLPIIGWFPRPNPDGLIYQIDEIGQASFNQYLLDGDTKIAANIRLLLGLIVGGLWAIIFILRVLGHFLFMGKIKNSHPGAAYILTICLVVTGILIVNYNSSGVLPPYLLATLLIGIGFSSVDVGSAHNNRGVAALKGESVGPSGKNYEDLENLIGELSTIKMKDNYDKAVFHFTKAIVHSLESEKPWPMLNMRLILLQAVR